MHFHDLPFDFLMWELAKEWEMGCVGGQNIIP